MRQNLGHVRADGRLDFLEREAQLDRPRAVRQILLREREVGAADAPGHLVLAVAVDPAARHPPLLGSARRQLEGELVDLVEAPPCVDVAAAPLPAHGVLRAAGRGLGEPLFVRRDAAKPAPAALPPAPNADAHDEEEEQERAHAHGDVATLPTGSPWGGRGVPAGEGGREGAKKDGGGEGAALVRRICVANAAIAMETLGSLPIRLLAFTKAFIIVSVARISPAGAGGVRVAHDEPGKDEYGA